MALRTVLKALYITSTGELIHYDSVATFTDGVTQEDMDTLEGDLSADGHIDDFLLNCGYSDDVKSSEDTETAEYVIVDDKNAFKDYVTLRTRRKHNDVVLGDSGVVITEKLSKDLGVKKGDKITVTSSAGKQAEAVVSGITEMYVNHYVYISTEYYNELLEIFLNITEFLLRLAVMLMKQKATWAMNIFQEIILRGELP